MLVSYRSGSYIWPSNDAPRYIAGFSVTTSLMCGTVITAFLLMVLTKKYPYENTIDGGKEQVPANEVVRTSDA
jgi:hypothetical protein